jgi:hypothetical protein
MGLNKSKGNMYGFVTHTWNTIKGKCYHDCGYCYMKRWGELKPVRFDENELKTDLGEGNFIFVGSSYDMWSKGDAFDDPRYYEMENWINKTLDHCEMHKNTYLFQTKNTFGFHNFIFPENSILCTTIETNRAYDKNKAPDVKTRAYGLNAMNIYKTMVTLEPIMDFDMKEMVELIELANPDYVNIGAMTGGHKYPEPSKEKVSELIEYFKDKIHLKKNLGRIMK